MKKLRAAIAWLLEEDWPRWQAIDPELPPYDRWLEKINQGIAAFEANGATAEKVIVDPDVFSEWCRAQGKPINRQNRADYAAQQLLKRSSMVKEFTISAALGRQTITAGLRSDTVDEMVADWGRRLKAEGPEERRSDTRSAVVTSLNDGTHHTNPDEAREIASALVWLAATGPMGEQLLELMRAGGASISYEIVRLREDAYNFRLGVDDKSKAALDRGSAG